MNKKMANILGVCPGSNPGSEKPATVPFHFWYVSPKYVSLLLLPAAPRHFGTVIH